MDMALELGREAERALKGSSVNAATFRRAADEALNDARPASENGFKVELAKRCIVQAFKQITS